MLPQGPTDEILRRLEPGKAIAVELKASHEVRQHAAALRQQGANITTTTGDIVVSKALPQFNAQKVGAVAGISTRLLPRFRRAMNRVSKMISPQTLTPVDMDPVRNSWALHRPYIYRACARSTWQSLTTPSTMGRCRLRSSAALHGREAR